MLINIPVVQFIDDDDGYLRWLEDHPGGFVINSNRNPSGKYLKLHRAACGHLGRSGGASWTGYYIKTCSSDLDALRSWALSATGCEPSPCQSCTHSDRPMDSGTAMPRARDDISALISSSSEHSIPRPDPIVTIRPVPTSIRTGCPEIDRAWESYATPILDRPGVAIPDTDEDLNWHAFLGHSLDMQGFRAAEFVGVDPMSRRAPDFVPLKERGIGVRELAALWEVPEIRDHLLGSLEGMPLEASFDILRAHGGATGFSLSEAFLRFPWRVFHWSLRALLENSAVLGASGYSFREWLRHECEDFGVDVFPPDDFRRPVQLSKSTIPLEMALRRRMERGRGGAFYRVGPAMSAYMLCDWQLWLWREGRTAVFANFKLDSFHEEFVNKYGRGLVPASEDEFAGWWLSLYPDLPPRLVNECLWLAVENNLFSTK